MDKTPTQFVSADSGWLKLIVATATVVATVVGVAQYLSSGEESAPITLSGTGIVAPGGVHAGGDVTVTGDAYQQRIRSAAIAYVDHAVPHCRKGAAAVEAANETSAVDMTEIMLQSNYFPDQTAAEHLGAGVVGEIERLYRGLYAKDAEPVLLAMTMNKTMESAGPMSPEVQAAMNQQFRQGFPAAKAALIAHFAELCSYLEGVSAGLRK